MIIDNDLLFKEKIMETKAKPNLPKSPPQVNIVRKIWREIKRPFKKVVREIMRPFRRYGNPEANSTNMFTIRNLKYNTLMRLNGWWDGYRRKKINEFFRGEVISYWLLKEQFRFYVLKQLNIPQVEFVLTSRCSLKCKNCANYIPSVSHHYTMDLQEFKENVSALAEAVNEVQTTLLLGGEPLLYENLPEAVEFIAKNEKFKVIYVITNGTITFKKNLLDIIHKYRHKVRVHISNYSANKELYNRLKIEKIKEQLKEYAIECHIFDNLEWSFISPPRDYGRSRESNKDYFLKCLPHCVQIANRQMHVCPKSTTFSLNEVVKFEDGEFVNLNPQISAKNLRKELIRFFSRDCFSACALCNRLDDDKKRCTPAEQI